MTYNDISVLENMHISTLYQVLRSEGCDVFGTLSETEWKAARRVIVGSIIATDMSHHFTMVSELDVFYTINENALNGTADQRVQLFENPKNRQFLLNSWMHAADISNPVKNFSVCDKWAKVVMLEFFAQGDKEKDLGMPISPGFDRAITSTYSMQVNFIEFVVGPLYQKLLRICPELLDLGIQIVHNRAKWGDKMLEEMAQKGDKDAGELVKARENEAGRRGKFRGNFSFVFDMQAKLRAGAAGDTLDGAGGGGGGMMSEGGGSDGGGSGSGGGNVDLMSRARRVPGARSLDFKGTMVPLPLPTTLQQ
jgi:hypothetical protein